MAHQTWDAERYAATADFVARLGAPLLALLAPRCGECILDLGCGDGQHAQRLLARGCRVVAVDSARSFVDAAKRRGVDARLMDAQALRFEREFDAVFSNAALHWMQDADAVLDGVQRALRPGGRFVAEFGGHGNVASVVNALQAELARENIDAGPLNPWYFPRPDAYRARLQAHGFEVHTLALLPRPTRLPGTLSDWLETFAQSFTLALPPAKRASFLQCVERRLAPRLRDGRGQWQLDYVRLRLAATLP